MESDQHILDAESMIGHAFEDRDLLVQALTHSSLVDARLSSNERLEFLGDAVLGLIVCEHLYDFFPDLLEGEMTKIKSTVVSRRQCAEVAQRLGIDRLIQLGKGMTARPELPGSVSGAAYEAIVGAILLDAGLEEARRFVLRDLGAVIEIAARCGHQSNFKSLLQQIAQHRLGSSPRYVVLDERGPDHEKSFQVGVEIDDTSYPPCWGSSKKEAEQDTALEALLALGFACRVDDGGVRMLVDEAGQDLDSPGE